MILPGLSVPAHSWPKTSWKRLCVEKYGWDDIVSEDLQLEWGLWKEDIKSVSLLRIPRCYQAKDFGEAERYEVYHYSDASIDGCGQ